VRTRRRSCGGGSARRRRLTFGQETVAGFGLTARCRHAVPTRALRSTRDSKLKGRNDGGRHQLRASEIKDVLLGEIERYEEDLQAEQVGEILEVKDGIARIYGLMGTMASEMLEITAETGEPSRRWR
jgi:hypothetical protein